jgi:hypothetical protein
MSRGCRSGSPCEGRSRGGSFSVNMLKCVGHSGPLPFGKWGKLGKQVLTSFGARSSFCCRASNKRFSNICCLFELAAFRFQKLQNQKLKPKQTGP